MRLTLDDLGRLILDEDEESCHHGGGIPRLSERKVVAAFAAAC
jgi:hypothetical protein